MLEFEVPDPLPINPFRKAVGVLFDPSEGENMDRKEFEKLKGKHLPVTIGDFPPLFIPFLPELSPIGTDPVISLFLLASSSVTELPVLKMGGGPGVDPGSAPRSPSIEGHKAIIWLERYAVLELYCAAGNVWEGAAR